MKSRIDIFKPLVFALFSFLFYVLVYHPPLKSVDFTTACLVFFSALGWSAVILYTNTEKKWPLVIYVSAALAIPLSGMELFKIFHIHRVWHRVLLGLMIFSIFSLMVFMRLVKRRRRQD